MAATKHSETITELPPDEQGVATVLIKHPPVNGFGASVLAGLQSAVAAVHANPRVRAFVIASAIKGVFVAGADVPSIFAGQQRHAAEPAKVERELTAFNKDGQDLLNLIEDGPKPAVAAIDGLALGGGCELAMSCAARVASAKSKFGLPELSLGLIPAWGGAQRLPRLIGVQEAVKITMSGRQMAAGKARSLGLVDAIAGDVLARARQVAAELAAGPTSRVRRHTLHQDDRLGPMPEMVIAGARKNISRNRKLKFLPQYKAYIDAVEAGLKRGGVAGLAKEREVMRSLMVGPVSKGMVSFFLNSRQTTKVPGVPKVKCTFKTVAVLGAGTMGGGIAALCAIHGFNVILKEINDKALSAGVARVEKILAKHAKKRKLSKEQAAALRARITPQTSYEGFNQADLVVEAAVEVLKIKHAIFKELEEVCRPDCVLATNTSSLPLRDIAQVLRPETRKRFLSYHYFSPAEVMPLLEVVRTDETAPEVIGATFAFAKATKKTPVLSGDCPGFIANRSYMGYGMAAALLVDAGVNPARIDQSLLKYGLAPMGVFQMADSSGVDIFNHVGETYNTAFPDRVYNSSLGKLLAAEGRLGLKTGRGYYAYEKGSFKPKPDPSLAPMLQQARADAAARMANWPPSFVAGMTDRDLAEAVLLPVVNEGHRVVGEGIALSEGDVSVASVMGYGFPVHNGGIMQWARTLSLRYVVARLTALAEQFGKHDASLHRFYYPCARLLAEARKE